MQHSQDPRPDFLISPQLPSKLTGPDQSYVVGDVKIGTRNIPGKRQFGVIFNHAHNYGYRVALYITARRNGQLKKVAAEALSRGTILFILVLLE
jgi:hypothetical protein